MENGERHAGGRDVLRDNDITSVRCYLFALRNGVITQDDTETENETYEMSKPIALLILSQSCVCTFIQVYERHFNHSRYLSLSWSRSRGV